MTQSNDTEITISDEEQQKLFKDAKSKQHCAQCALFANVNYSDLDDDGKQTIVNVLLKYDEQTKKHSQKENQISYPAFCKVLQQLENADKRVEKALHEFGDRSSMSGKFKDLGFKLRGDVAILEALLFLFNIKVSVLFSKPLSPGDARLRRAKFELNKLTQGQKDLEDKKDNLQKQLDDYVENNKPMQATRTRNELKSLTDQINSNAVQYKRDLKKRTKEVDESEKNLYEEKSKGTDADHWLEEACKKNRIQFYKY